MSQDESHIEYDAEYLGEGDSGGKEPMKRAQANAGEVESEARELSQAAKEWKDKNPERWREYKRKWQREYMRRRRAQARGDQ